MGYVTGLYHGEQLEKSQLILKCICVGCAEFSREQGVSAAKQDKSCDNLLALQQRATETTVVREASLQGCR